MAEIEAVEDAVTGFEGTALTKKGPAGYGREFLSKLSHYKDAHYRYESAEEAEKCRRKRRKLIARAFWGRCTFNTVLKTRILSSGHTNSWLDHSFGLTWVAVHAMDKSVAVVTRHRDLDMECVSKYHQTLPKSRVVGYVTEAIISDVEGLAYENAVDELLRKKKSFSVVSVFPGTKTGEYDMDKAVKFLSGKMECETAITVDDAIKTAISGFKHLCQEELKAEDYWVSFLGNRSGCARRMMVPDIEKHLAAINELSGSRKRKWEADGLTSLCD